MFIEVPANKQSITNRKQIHGAGTNDADYMVSGRDENGKITGCPYYARWANMIERCYSDAFQKIRPTYIGCTVCDEWLNFLSFKAWMIRQDWKGNTLDKDLLIQGNKVYSPKSCIFVSTRINLLFNNNRASRGDYPQGVHFSKNTDNYRASVMAKGKIKHLGLFDTPEQAHEAYKTEKYIIISDIASQQTEPLKSALLNYKISEY